MWIIHRFASGLSGSPDPDGEIELTEDELEGIVGAGKNGSQDPPTK